jgi:hypothetical protein
MAAEVMGVIGTWSFIPVEFSMGGMMAFELIRMNVTQLTYMVLLNSNCHTDLLGRKTDRYAHLKFAKIQDIEKLIQQEYLSVYF